MLLSHLLEEYLLSLQVKNYSVRTIETKGHYINSFIQFTDDISIFKVNKVMVNNWILAEKEKCKAQTINGKIIAVRTMFKYAVKEEYLQLNPLAKVEMLKEETTVIRTYSDSNIHTLLESFKGKGFIPTRNKTIVTMLMETGIRNSELCGITLDDIKGDSIRILGKGSKERYVGISKPLMLQLTKYMRVREKWLDGEGIISPYLFLKNGKKQMTRYTVLKMIKDLGKKLGIEQPTVHKIRHWYSQTMLDNVDIYYVSKILGHSSVTTTERYLRGLEDRKLIEKSIAFSPLSKR
jgi:integrase/recombinase XerD